VPRMRSWLWPNAYGEHRGGASKAIRVREEGEVRWQSRASSRGSTVFAENSLRQAHGSNAKTSQPEKPPRASARMNRAEQSPQTVNSKRVSFPLLLLGGCRANASTVAGGARIGFADRGRARFRTNAHHVRHEAGTRLREDSLKIHADGRQPSVSSGTADVERTVIASLVRPPPSSRPLAIMKSMWCAGTSGISRALRDLVRQETIFCGACAREL